MVIATATALVELADMCREILVLRKLSEKCPQVPIGAMERSPIGLAEGDFSRGVVLLDSEFWDEGELAG
jgi:3'-phosphoadenosine 5'-phosphosulfate (PAPS) 3'-phosphatase